MPLKKEQNFLGVSLFDKTKKYSQHILFSNCLNITTAHIIRDPQGCFAAKNDPLKHLFGLTDTI